MRWVAKTGSQATYQSIYDALCELEDMEAADMVKDLAGQSHGVLSLPTHTHTRNVIWGLGTRLSRRGHTCRCLHLCMSLYMMR